jgi:hypothetical protein
MKLMEDLGVYRGGKHDRIEDQAEREVEDRISGWLYPEFPGPALVPTVTFKSSLVPL